MGLFVTIEGGEGVGKTTLISMLEQYFDKTSYRYVRTREPGGTPEAEAIRSHILNPQFPKEPDYSRGFMTEIFLFCAARADHVQRLIVPALADGKLVICDRYFDSTMAYQVAAAPEELRPSIRKVIAELNSPKFGIIEPHVTFLLEAPEDVLAKRVFQRSGGKLDFIEQRTQEYHRQVRKNFSDMAEGNKRFVRINANRPRHAVLLDVLDTLERFSFRKDLESLKALPA